MFVDAPDELSYQWLIDAERFFMLHVCKYSLTVTSRLLRDHSASLLLTRRDLAGSIVWNESYE